MLKKLLLLCVLIGIVFIGITQLQHLNNPGSSMVHTVSKQILGASTSSHSGTLTDTVQDAKKQVLNTKISDIVTTVKGIPMTVHHIVQTEQTIQGNIMHVFKK